MNRLACLLAAWLLAAGLVWAQGPLVVIVNPASGVDTLTRDEAVNIFMGRYKKLPSGIAALPVDEGGAKAAFYRAIVGKELPEIHSYWARLVFSGQGSPPRQMETPAEVIDIVANNRGAIGYVEKGKLGARVKVVLELGR